MKSQQILGWLLVVVGILFLVSGLVVTIFATMPMMASSENAPMAEAAPSSVWVGFANRIMDFTLEMMIIDWNPTRVGILFIIVGMLLEGMGAYALILDSK